MAKFKNYSGRHYGRLVAVSFVDRKYGNSIWNHPYSRELACDTQPIQSRRCKLLLGYRDNMRVEVETGIAVAAKTVADLRALPAWPDGLALNIHVDLDPRLSVVKVERAS